MPDPQPAILRPVPPSARFLTFALREGAKPGAVLGRVAEHPHDADTVIGVGAPFATLVAAYRSFPSDIGLFPSTQAALWVVLAHADRAAQLDGGSFVAVQKWDLRARGVGAS